MQAYIPYGVYWSTPYAKWQGSLAHLHALRFAAHVAKAELGKREVAATAFDFGVLGTTVPQQSSFYGLPWVMGMLGAPGVTGPTINQACATGARCLATAAFEVGHGASSALVLTADRTSNGPHLYYPNPGGPGGTGGHEDWVLDSFSKDPFAKVAMIQTAENVAAKHGFSTEAQHDVVAQRFEQYQSSLADDHAFQRRYMTLPFDVPDARFRKTVTTMDGDEGVFPTTRDKLAKLRPVQPEGTVTFGGQTHPADGSTAMVVASREKAREMSLDPSIEVRILGFGQARTDAAFMPEATVPAAQRALEQADVALEDVAAIKSHNPFAVNDLVFAKETGASLATMNNYGCSLVWGHPQGPTGLRAVVELVEELAIRGGGVGLFHGCAAGDSAMSLVLEVGDPS